MSSLNLADMEAAFQSRVAANAGITRIDNTKLPAGSPMSYYCKDCNAVITLPETHTGAAPRQCEDCLTLDEARAAERV